ISIMSIFHEWQPRYAAHGIATFPIKFVEREDGKFDKVPMVKGYLRVGTRRSAELVARGRFANCGGLGFCLVQPYGGPKLTILDVDIADEQVLTQALDRHGDTPVIARTAT